VDRIPIAREAARRAIELREQIGVAPNEPVNVIEVAERLGIMVHLSPQTSVEGLYARTNPPNIITSAHRPSGRITFSIGHELGHHIYGHPGVSIDEMKDAEEPFGEKPLHEMQADYFSGHFLMPNRGVRAALAARKWDPKALLPDQAFRLACVFGVSYAAMAAQLRFNLNMIDQPSHARLLSLKPMEIKESILGIEHPRDLMVIDRSWENPSVDLRTGDFAMVAGDCRVEGACGAVEGKAGAWTIIKPIRQGIGKILRPEGPVVLRVSGKMNGDYFTGLSTNRFEEDPDDAP